MMKRLWLLFFFGVFAISVTQAQKTFEGTITYSYAVQGENAAMMATFMPNKMVIKYTDERMLTYFEGGLMGDMIGRIVVDGKKKMAFLVKDSEETIYQMNNEKEEKAEPPVVTEMKETEIILGYQCQKYKVVSKEKGKENTQSIWITKKMKMPLVDMPGVDQANGVVFSRDLPGFPMKIEMEIPNTSTRMIIKVTGLDKTKVKAEEFAQPKGFQVKDYSEYMKGKE